jgi:hypothetical protein
MPDYIYRIKLSTLFRFFFLITALFPEMVLKAQSNKDDSAFYQASIQNAVTFYQQSALDQSRLNNGRKYKAYSFRFVNGTPFFETDQFREGSVVYEGGYYDNVKLLYDQVQDKVIVRTNVAIELITERIEQFTISNNLFVKLSKDSLNSHLDNGFYEQLYKGKIVVYKKEKKVIKENLSTDEGVRGDVEKKTFYYLQKDGIIYLIKKKAHVFEILGDKKNEIQKFMKSNDLSFKSDPEKTLTKIAAYYDQLTN